MTSKTKGKKKILIISQNYYPEIGSHGNRIKNLSLLFHKNNFEVDVLTSYPTYPHRKVYSNDKFWDEPDIEKNINIYRSEVKTRKYSRNMFERLRIYIEFMFNVIKIIIKLKKQNKKYDYVYITSPPIFLAFPAIIAKKLFKTKMILGIRDLWPKTVEDLGVFKNKVIFSLAYYFEKKVLHFADKIIINSPGFKDYIVKKGISEKDIYLLCNGVTHEELNIKRCRNNNNEKIIIYTGNVGLAQDIKILVDVANKLKEHKNIKFKIIGFGVEYNEVQEKVKLEELSNIEFLDILPRKEALQNIKNADIAFLNLKDKEVFETVIPGKVIDYLSMGTPIVAGVKGVASNIIRESGGGVVCSQHDSDEIANTILELLNDNHKLKNLSDNGIKYIKENFVIEDEFKGFLDFLGGSHE